MITNWYSTNIDLDYLSQRLRAAYALWVSASSPSKLPSLDQIQSSSVYEDLSPYIAMVEDQGDADHRTFVFSAAGSKVIELFGVDLTARRIDEVFTESGQSLAEEIFAVLRNERKPVLLSVSGSSVVSKDIEVIAMPLLRVDAATELALLVYDF